MRFPIIVLGLTVLPRVVAAQCPDGTPPPCRPAAPARATAPAAPDTTRIAIFPFRVTAADSLLGEGIAELLSTEFNGGSGPRAVHMGTVIRAFRQAGGSARAPLTQPVAARTARQVGAGLYLDGSVVGLGGRLTITASVVSSVDGQVRRSEPIRGSADSLDVLLSRTAATLVALAGGESREGSRGVLTSSSAAMRAYVEGMAAWRRFHADEASAAFERALREDSTFARAALMRYWIANFIGRNTGDWARALFAQRARLSSGDRLLVTAMLGDDYPTPRRPAQSFGDRARAAALLPESPEAQYLAGDWLFHYGGAIDATDWGERARDYFARSFSLDSQQTVLAHLVDVAVLTGDSALLRSLQPALLARLSDMRAPNLLAAGYLGDRAWRSRAQAAPGQAGVVIFEAAGLLPAPAIDDFIEAFSPNEAQRGLMRAVFADMQGRPEAARRALASTADAFDPSMLAALQSLFGDADSASGAAAVARLSGMTGLSPGQAGGRDCVVALWYAWHGETGSERRVPEGDVYLNCATVVDVLRARNRRDAEWPARLAAADSLVRGRQSPARNFGVENFVLARLWEEQGDKRRALSGIRLYPVGNFPLHGVGRRLREEGRLAAEVGELDRAIRAYRLYLDYRKDAEPALIPQRDSVRAALNRLVTP